MCGEMASELRYVPLLLGLGLDEFSVSAPALLKIKKIIRSVSYEDAKQVAEDALLLSTGKEVEALVARKFKDIIEATEDRKQV